MFRQSALAPGALSFLLTASLCQAQPSIAANGVVSAQEFGAFTSIAPGSWIEIYGSSLATTTTGWASSDFNGVNAPTSLGGTKVTVGGQDAFIDYVSPAQVNAQVPSGVGTGLQNLTVTTAAGTSTAYPILVDAVEPGLLAPSTFASGATQYVAALFSDGATYVLPPGAVNGITSKRAQPGDVITLYGVGFGPVTPNIPAGQIVQQSNTLALPLQILFGTTPAQISYSGLAPNAVGLYQFNVTVPNIMASDMVPLTFNLGGTPGDQILYTAVENSTSTTAPLPPFYVIDIRATITIDGQTSPNVNGVNISGPGTGTYASGVFTAYPSTALASSPSTEFQIQFDSVSLSGLTFTFGNLDIGPKSLMSGADGASYAVTSASLTVTLTPNGAPSVGSASGSFSVAGPLTTITGTLWGTYTAQ